MGHSSPSQPSIKYWVMHLVGIGFCNRNKNGTGTETCWIMKSSLSVSSWARSSTGAKLCPLHSAFLFEASRLFLLAIAFLNLAVSSRNSCLSERSCWFASFKFWISVSLTCFRRSWLLTQVAQRGPSSLRVGRRSSPGRYKKMRCVFSRLRGKSSGSGDNSLQEYFREGVSLADLTMTALKEWRSWKKFE